MYYNKTIILIIMFISILLFTPESSFSIDTASSVPYKSVNGKALNDGRLAALNDINDSIVSLSSALKEKENSLISVVSDEKKKLIQLEIDKINGLIDTREKEFVSIVLGDDIDTFEYSSSKNFSLKDELQDVIRPAVEELKRITKHPRDIEKLRREITFYEKKIPVIKSLLQNADTLNQPNADVVIRKKLENIQKTWGEKEKEYSRQLAKLQFQISQKQTSKQSYLKTIQENALDFFKSRGLNILLAALLFMSVFVLLRYFQRRFSKYVKESETTSFYHKLTKVFFHVFTILSALSASLLLLYTMGDWVLLSIILILIAGILWSARQGLVGYWEQVRLLLDIGSVRQGERLVYNGIPWQVVSINLMTILQNPLLQGGQIRLPLKSIMGLQSRPFHPDEPWFPSRPADFVLLNDTTWGKVLTQSPESVVMEVQGGCRKTYPSSAFLQQNPINQSINTFGVPTVFGIDYAEQHLITTEIPAKIHDIVSEALKQGIYGEHLTKVTVQFKEAGESSLKVLVYPAFNGNAADSFYAIGREVQKILVNACTENNWGIPFSQLTLHLPEKIDEK